MKEKNLKIVFLLGFIPNPRMIKRITAAKQIATVSLICWDKGNNSYVWVEDAAVKAKIIKIKAQNDPLKRFVPYRNFSKAAMAELGIIKPDVIHVQGLDMLKIAVAYKDSVDIHTRIIYEVADLHRLIVDKSKSPIKFLARNYLTHEDRKCCKQIDKLIVTSRRFVDDYFKTFIPDDKILYIPNVPSAEPFKSYKRKNDGSKFTLGYLGSVRYKEQMRNLIEASSACDINVLIAGFEEGDNEIEHLCSDKKNVKCIGRFDFKKQAAELYGQCDAIYSVYNADMNNVKVALPNKLYEAVYCELPIIVAKNTYLAEIVSEWNVGIAVDHHSVDELKNAIEKLKNDNGYYQDRVLNCHSYKNIVNLDRYNELYKEVLLNAKNIKQ